MSELNRLNKTMTMLILLGFLLLTACAAPSERAWEGRRDVQQMIQRAGEPAKDGNIGLQTAAPKECLEHFSDENRMLNVTVSADVTVPEAESARLIRIRGNSVTQDEVDEWRAKLLGDGTVYDAARLCGCSFQELEQLWRRSPSPVLWEGTVTEQIVGYEASHEVMGETSIRTEPDENAQAAVFFETETPEIDAVSLRETEGQLTNFDTKDSGVLLAALEEDGLRFLRAANVNGLGQICYLGRGDLTAPYGSAYRLRVTDLHDSDFRLWVQSPEPEIAEWQAEQLAGAFLEDMGIGEDWSAASEELVMSIPRGVDGDGAYLGSVYRCWRVDYIRTLGGVPVLLPPDETGQRLTLFVTDDGVTELYYDLPWTEETVVERCRLLPFQEIMSVFRTMMPVLYLFTPGPDSDILGMERNCTITSIQFGYTPIPESSDGTASILVPAWTFLGTEQYEKATKSGYILEGSRPETVIMTINAVDGSVIYPT